MAKKAHGGVLQRGKRFFVQVTIAKGPKGRPAYPMPTCTTPDAAKERAAIVTDLVWRLRQAGQELAHVVRTAEDAARATPERLDEIIKAVEAMLSGDLSFAGGAFVPSKKMTFRQLGEAWTSGALSRTYPDHVPFKATATDDGWRLEKHVYPHVADIPVTHFSLDDAQDVLRKLSPKLSPASRRHVAQLMARVLKLGAYPCRIIPRSPIPVGFLPRLRGEKALEYIYPDEDEKLLAHTEIPLPYRMMYGILAREGMRSGELSRMTFADVDLDRGAVRLDKNKTDDPRAWALDPGVALALKLWKEHFRGGVEDGAFILVEPDIRKHPAARRICVDRLAVRFRAHLKKAKVTRPALFEKSPTRRPVRIHDLRATFVTLALANGKTEAWIADRTGHRSSVMINRYRRAARKVEELGLGTLTPLHLAIPELAKLAKLLPIPAKAPQSQPQSQRASSRVSERHRDMAKTSGKVATRYPRRTHLREFRFRRRKS